MTIENTGSKGVICITDGSFGRLGRLFSTVTVAVTVSVEVVDISIIIASIGVNATLDVAGKVCRAVAESGVVITAASRSCGLGLLAVQDTRAQAISDLACLYCACKRAKHLRINGGSCQGKGREEGEGLHLF